ncbi:MAG: hypothetical protein VR70_15060, partial [Rhodospirillaceae bacterium BRH_c57]
MNVFNDIKTSIVKVLADLAVEGVIPADSDFSRVTAEPPRDPAHGDISTNAAMVLAKGAGLKPRDLAETLVARLSAHPDVTAAEVAGPGFINL